MDAISENQPSLMMNENSSSRQFFLNATHYELYIWDVFIFKSFVISCYTSRHLRIVVVYSFEQMAITEKGGPEVLCSREQQQETEAKTDLLLGLRECSVFIILCTNIFVHYSLCARQAASDCDNANLNK